MKILILGIDGYIGYPLAIHLLKKGHTICGLDNLSRRRRVAGAGGSSLTEIGKRVERAKYLDSLHTGSTDLALEVMDVSGHYQDLRLFLEYNKPEAIVHLAEQPSAPWSMIDVHRAVTTQVENITGTLNLLWAMKEVCSNAHLVKLGTMGEYGTPNCEIPEGRIPKLPCIHLQSLAHVHTDDHCPMQGLLFPRTPGSFYHLSKVHDTHNIEFACRNWGLRSTDIMQGVVYGLGNPESDIELTRFDYDECFGTVINRFCAQALIGHPLTVYGKGGQTRGYLPLSESIECLTLSIENPPEGGEYRTFNQFGHTYSVLELANIVSNIMPVEISNVSNPRKEAELHMYEPVHEGLKNLGYEPCARHAISNNVYDLIDQLRPFKDRIQKHVMMPTIKWR